MLISEPMTMLTDYAIAAEAVVFAGLLLWLAFQRRQISIGFWAVAFACLVIAASAGGTYHGFALYLNGATRDSLWLVVLYALSFASFWMLAATIASAVPPRWQRSSLIAIGIKSLLFIRWSAVGQSFGNVVVDYLSAMTILLFLHAYRQTPSARWLARGVLVSAIGAIVQLSGFGLAERFNHNDLYHVVQMVALYLFYRGARLSKDW